AVQAHAVAAVEQVLAGHRAGGGQHGRGLPAPPRAAGEHGLDVRIPQPARRRVACLRPAAVGTHAAIAATIRSRAMSAIRRRPSASPGWMGARNTTSTGRAGSPSRRTKLPKKLSPGAKATAAWALARSP